MLPMPKMPAYSQNLKARMLHMASITDSNILTQRVAHFIVHLENFQATVLSLLIEIEKFQSARLL